MVLDAASVFARRGYDQTSMQELSAAMGLAAGSLYHYFSSKENLLIAICDQLMHPLLAKARSLEQASGKPEDQLRELTRCWVQHVVEHRDHVLVSQQQRHVIDHGRQWRDVRRDRKLFEALLDRFVARTAKASFEVGDLRLARFALLGMVNHTAQWYRPRGPLGVEQIADGYTAMVLGANRG